MFTDHQQIREFKASTSTSFKREPQYFEVKDFHTFKVFARTQRDFLKRTASKEVADKYSRLVSQAIRLVNVFGLEHLSWDWEVLFSIEEFEENGWSRIPRNESFYGEKSDMIRVRTGLKHLLTEIIEASESKIYNQLSISGTQERVLGYAYASIKDFLNSTPFEEGWKYPDVYTSNFLKNLNRHRDCAKARAQSPVLNRDGILFKISGGEIIPIREYQHPKYDARGDFRGYCTFNHEFPKIPYKKGLNIEKEKNLFGMVLDQNVFNDICNLRWGCSKTHQKLITLVRDKFSEYVKKIVKNEDGTFYFLESGKIIKHSPEMYGEWVVLNEKGEVLES